MFFKYPSMQAAKLSPDGRHIAVQLGAANGRYLLGVVDFDGANPKVLAHFSDADVRDFYWVNDDWLVFEIVDLSTGAGWSRIGPGLYSVDRNGDGLRQLVASEYHFFSEHRIAAVRPLSVQHQLLHVPARGGPSGNDVIVGEWDFDAQGDPRAVRPKRLNVVTGRAESLAYGMPEHATGWLFDRTGAPRVAIVSRDGRVEVHWRADIANDSADAWKVIGEWPALKARWWPRRVDPAGNLYVLVPNGARGGEEEMARFDFATGKPQLPALVSTPGFDFDGEVVSEVSGDRILGFRVTTDAETTVWLDPAMKALQQEIDRRLPGRVNRLTCRRCDQPDRSVLVASWSDRQPVQFWGWRGEPGAPTAWGPVGQSRREVDPRAMATLDLHRYKARDGRSIPLWVTLPAGHKAGDPPAPAVVLVHGGPWVRGTYWGWSPMSQFLASRGYVVLEPEFRGSTGYGDDHFRAGWKQWGLAMQDDLADAVAWAAAQRLVDDKRVCIAGPSYGGYATLMSLARHPDVYRCGVAWVAVTEPALLFENSWANDVTAEIREHRLPVLIGDPKTDAALLRDASPVQHAARITAPVLLAYGSEDRRVPLEHGERMRAALKAAGHPPQWVVYDGEAHGWRKTENNVDFARRVERFLADNLR